MDDYFDYQGIEEPRRHHISMPHRIVHIVWALILMGICCYCLYRCSLTYPGLTGVPPFGLFDVTIMSLCLGVGATVLNVIAIVVEYFHIRYLGRRYRKISYSLNILAMLFIASAALYEVFSNLTPTVMVI